MLATRGAENRRLLKAQQGPVLESTPSGPWTLGSRFVVQLQWDQRWKLQCCGGGPRAGLLRGRQGSSATAWQAYRYHGYDRDPPIEARAHSLRPNPIGVASTAHRARAGSEKGAHTPSRHRTVAPGFVAHLVNSSRVRSRRHWSHGLAVYTACDPPQGRPFFVVRHSSWCDPTGRQDTRDASEIRIFTYWRRAIVLIWLDFALKVTVLIVQLINRRPARTIFWTLGLMAAPWAPLIDKVATAIMNWIIVRELMCSRVPRNEISCVLREYLKMGHQNVTTTSMAEEVFDCTYALPEKVFEAVIRTSSHSIGHNLAYRERVHKLLKDVKDKGASWMVTSRAQRHGPEKQKQSSVHLRRLQLRRIDMWMRYWTLRKYELLADPFPPGLLSLPVAESGDENAYETDATKGGALDVDPDELPAHRAYVLDAIDDCLNGHTLSQQRSLNSVRGAIEAFLESSNRAHVNVHARAWLDDTHIEWRGRLEIICDGMWESVFVDQTGLLVEDEEPTENKDAGDARPVPNATVTTRKLLVFLFMVARSTLKACLVLDKVGNRVMERLHSRAWWTDYWQEVVRSLGTSRNSDDTVEDWMDGIKARVLRDVSVGEMKALVRLLADQPARPYTGHDVEANEIPLGSFCNAPSCYLGTLTTCVVRVTNTMKD